MSGRASKLGFPPSSVLKCTDKVGKAALLIQERCNACHGRTVQDVIGSMNSNGSKYGMADLRYDIKGGRFEVLPPGSKAGAPPVGKARADAPRAGQKLPEATVDEFLMFLQCQLRMELREHASKKLELADKKTNDMWPHVEAFVTPNLGATERWVPYHTILGVHELFLVESVHHKAAWDEKQKFLAMFIFRAHCKRDLFTTTQMPLMNSSFWKDPKKAFQPGGPMEQAMVEYRRKTKKPMITSCFRIIPPRVLANDDANLVRSITNRTINLLEVAEKAFPVMKDRKKTPVQKVDEISAMVQGATGLGETWAKMLTVCIDLAYPKENMLETQCDVGTGAAPTLRCLLPKGKFKDSDKKAGLKELLKVVNSAKGPPAKNFWSTLKKAEDLLKVRFKALPLVLAQTKTRQHGMTACTLQVQLCEYRQFRHSIARLQYGLPDDENMRGDVDVSTKLSPDNFLEVDKKEKCTKFQFPTKDDKKIGFKVPWAVVGGNEQIAYRVASLSFLKLRDGASEKEMKEHYGILVAGYRSGADVPKDSEAWALCRVQVSHTNPVVGFHVELKNGSKIPFQTTAQASGSILEAERIARLCWCKLKAGAKKDDVLEYRNQLYKKRSCDNAASGQPPSKKARTHGA